MNWLLNRLHEPSTWRGLVWLLTVCGIVLKPEQTEAVIAFGMAVAGLLGVFLKDRSSKERTRATDQDQSTGPTALPPIQLVGKSDSLQSDSVDDGDTPARFYRRTDDVLRNSMPSESEFKHQTERRQGVVGWNDE